MNNLGSLLGGGDKNYQPNDYHQNLTHKNRNEIETNLKDTLGTLLIGKE